MCPRLNRYTQCVTSHITGWIKEHFSCFIWRHMSLVRQLRPLFCFLWRNTSRVESTKALFIFFDVICRELAVSFTSFFCFHVYTVVCCVCGLLFNFVKYVFLLLCILIVMVMYYYCYVFLLLFLCIIVKFIYSYCYVFLLLWLCIHMYLYCYVFLLLCILIVMYSYCYDYVFLLLSLCILIVWLCILIVTYAPFCVFRSIMLNCVLCVCKCALYCLCVNVHCTVCV
jgi:hypothetical protein